MSFFKAIGRGLGTAIGARSGASKQFREFTKEANKQYAISLADAQAQNFAFQSQADLQQIYDQTQQDLERINREETLLGETRVELADGATKPRKSVFGFGV